VYRRYFVHLISQKPLKSSYTFAIVIVIDIDIDIDIDIVIFFKRGAQLSPLIDCYFSSRSSFLLRAR